LAGAAAGFTCAICGGIHGARAVTPAWIGYANGEFHDANAPTASDALSTIRWQTPVDAHPQFSGNDLLIHYGSPMITSANTILVPQKTGATDGFSVTAINAATGLIKWTQASDYTLPMHNWTPSYAPTLTPSGTRMYYAGNGGTIDYLDNPDSNSPTLSASPLVFYGASNYTGNPSAFNSSVFINTPITSDAAGDIYFGYRATASNPLSSTMGGGGIARIAANGDVSFITAANAAPSDSSITTDVMNCAPALSRDGTKLYAMVSNAPGSGAGDLVELNATTLAPLATRSLIDPSSGMQAFLPDDGTASPTVGSDGHVYIGVLENPFPNNYDRGWLLQFTGDLSQSKTPGAFGWDDTASIVPASMVHSYHGSSSYLLMTKYNNYAGLGGTGVNMLAILDPNDTETDPVTDATVMKEVLTIAGVTPDSEFPLKPGAVREWCINSAVVDPLTDSILANSEDGKLYRWDLSTNSFTQVITLTPGVGEAYTPTLVGPDGAVYAINNATLFSVVPEPGAGAMLLSAMMLGVSRRGRRR
jgi:hypothetical protein